MMDLDTLPGSWPDRPGVQEPRIAYGPSVTLQ